MSLQTRYSGQILLVIVSLVVCLAVVSLRQIENSSAQLEATAAASLREHLEHQIEERARVMSEYLAQNLVNPLLRYDMQGMLELAGTAAAQPDVLFVYVVDAQGRILQDGTPDIDAFGQDLQVLLGWEPGSPQRAVVRTLGGAIHVVKPVRLGQQTLGGVAVGLSLDLVAEEIAHLRSGVERVTASRYRSELAGTALTAGLFLLAGIALALWTARKLASPIRHLSALALRIGQGDYGAEIAISRDDEIGDLANAFRNMSDELAESHREVQFLAYHDPLTGLPNRARLARILDDITASCRKGGGGAAVLFVDLDDFKPINDTLGHDAGDVVLREAASRLQACLPASAASDAAAESPQSAVARIGGDEFTIVAQYAGGIEELRELARGVLSALAEPFRVGGREIRISASVGVAVYPSDGRDAESLLTHADVAMYHAKKRGKNAFRFYDETMYERTRDRLFMLNDLQRALDREELAVHYQPMLDCGTGVVAGVEALVRWDHPERGVMPAADFIDVAEQGGLVDRLGEWVLERVCRDLSEWRAAGFSELFVSVNVSATQFARQDLGYLTGRSLVKYGLGPGSLRFEIAERSLGEQHSGTAALLEQLRAMGQQVWVDDFGSGHATLLNLRQVPANGIKIGQAFICDLELDEDDRRIVRAMLSMAQALKLEVAAVGVTDDRQARWLRDNGCRYVQGTFLSRELPASRIPALVQRTRALAGGHDTAHPLRLIS